MTSVPFVLIQIGNPQDYEKKNELTSNTKYETPGIHTIRLLHCLFG